MNIFRRELKQGAKPFLIWVLVILFLVIGGLAKFIGVSGAESGSMNEMLSAFPKAVLALFGMAEADIETFGGFYAVLQFYVMVAVSCYAVTLGTNAVLRESFDKTYEFLFTKPCGRLYILSMKLLSGFILLTLLCGLNLALSYASPGIYGIENDISAEMPLFALSLYLISLLFFCGSALIAVLLNKSELAVKLSYSLLLVCYGISVLFDMDEKFEVLRFLTPFKYFRISELLKGDFSLVYAVAVIIMSIVFTCTAFLFFKKKDLTAA